MLYTSYLAKMQSFPAVTVLFSVMRFTPSWARSYVSDLSSLAPSAQLFRENKAGLSHEDFERRYTAELNERRLETVVERLRNYAVEQTGVYVLLCCEADDSLCHRKILAKWLTSKGIDVKEWS